MAPWIVEKYASDSLSTLAPVTRDTRLLKLIPAAQAARRILKNGRNSAVLLPLGFEDVETKVYSVLKPSAFVYQTPRQLAAIERQVEKLRRTAGAGLDLLALRRSYKGRPGGLLSDAARRLYEYIQSGGKDLAKAFNLRDGRRSEAMKQRIQHRQQVVRSVRDDARQQLETAMFIDPESAHQPTLGIVLTRETVEHILLENA